MKNTVPFTFTQQIKRGYAVTQREKHWKQYERFCIQIFHDINFVEGLEPELFTKMD